MTRCRILALLRVHASKARSWGYLAAVPEFRLFREQHRIRFLSEDEAEWLTIASSGELKAFVVFLLNTALRPGEALPRVGSLRGGLRSGEGQRGEAATNPAEPEGPGRP